MKKIASYIVIIIVSLSLISGLAYARAAVVRGPKHKTVIVKKGPRPVVVKKAPGHGVVVVKKVWYPRRTVIVVGKPYHYRPWRFMGRIVIVAPAVIYTYPHPNSVVVISATGGTEYQVIEEVDGWYHIRSEGKDGWVQKDKVDVTEVKEEVATEEAK